MSIDTSTAVETDGVETRDPSDESTEAADRSSAVANVSRSIAKRLDAVWREPRAGLALAVVLGATWGLVVGRWTPRGPLTSAEALWSIVISLVVGGLAGLISRSRWAVLLAPLSFAIVVEIVRAGIDGPTVDRPVFSTYGVLALVVGRLFHALLSLAPMSFGAALGLGAARHLGNLERGRGGWAKVRRGVMILSAVGLVAFMLVLARPARTDAIRDANGNTVSGSIAELDTVDINGHDLALMIRGHSLDNPVLLYLAGGPGGSELGAMRNHLSELEEHFTVVTWDQRGTGKSYPELDPTDTITLDGFVDDTIAVTNHLRRRFGQDQIYLLGQSWGSALGVLAAQQQPELYRAYIGTGQMVDIRATDQIFYEDTLEWATETGKGGLVDDLTAIGPPPYESVLDYETALSFEHEVYPYDHTGNSEGEGGFSENFLVEEYSLIEQVHLLGAFMDTFTALYPQVQDIDFRSEATTFEVPVFFVQGTHEARGRAEVFEEWFPMIDAPTKDLTELSTSGHRPLFEQPDEFVDYMVETVLAQTPPG